MRRLRWLPVCVLCLWGALGGTASAVEEGEPDPVVFPLPSATPQDFYVHLREDEGYRIGQISLTRDGEALVPPENACAASFGGPTVAVLVGPDAEVFSVPTLAVPFKVVRPRCEAVATVELPEAVHTLWLRGATLWWLDAEGRPIQAAFGSDADYGAEPALVRSRNALSQLLRGLGPAGAAHAGQLSPLFALADGALLELESALARVSAERAGEALGALAPSVAQLDGQAAAAVRDAQAQLALCRSETRSGERARAFVACAFADSSLDLADRSLELANQFSDTYTPPGGEGHVFLPR